MRMKRYSSLRLKNFTKNQNFAYCGHFYVVIELISVQFNDRRDIFEARGTRFWVHRNAVYKRILGASSASQSRSNIQIVQF